MVYGQLLVGQVAMFIQNNHELMNIVNNFPNNFQYSGRLGTSNTVAALDLGGGSTQVTFAPKDSHKTPLLAEYMHTVSVPNAKIDVFTTSYLNLGLQAVRHAVFTHGSAEGNKNLESICVNPIIRSNPFKYGTKTYNLR